MALVPGRHIGNFEILRLIGEGGFGEVYEARNPLIQRRVAIKVLHADLVQDGELVRRFLNEARAASAIHHPNIVEVFDAGMTPEHEPYIVMEYLDGDPLHEVIASQGRLGVRVTQEITRQACSALAAAHAAGIVHRDLKPENLFVLQNPTSPLGLEIKVLDFGIAKIKRSGERDSTMKTRSGLVMGSPAYMSPEQCKDSSDVDLRSDIYSMAVMVYEMLTGRPPFVHEAAAELLLMQMSVPPPPMRGQVEDLPEHVEKTVLRALAKERDERFESIDYFIGALLGTYPAQTAPDGARTPTPRPAATRRGSPAMAPATTGTVIDDEARGPVKEGGSRVALAKSSTTLADATGETGPSELGARSERRRARWRALTLAGATATALVLVLGVVMLSRSSRRPAAEATAKPATPAALAAPATARAAPEVRWRIHSTPSGATVIDDRDGTSLGQTPLEKTVGKANGTVGLTLRLAGYRDETVSLALDADASAVVNLRAEAASDEGKLPAKTAPAPRRRTAQARQSKRAADDEWIAH